MKRLYVIVFLILASVSVLSAQKKEDKKIKEHEIMQEADIRAAQKEIDITIRSVDITNFPEIKIFIEAFNKLGEPLDSLNADNLFIYEKGVSKRVLDVQKVPVTDEVTVDFVFVVDITGSMGKHINSIRTNIQKFANTLVARGIDYRIGLILFSDDLGRVYPPSSEVHDLIDWLANVQAVGGGDSKENALEGLEAAANKIEYREGANRVAVLITDAPYHQEGEYGDGVTNQTTESITKLLVNNDIRLFSIVKSNLDKYRKISAQTRGRFYDIKFPFQRILDNFSNQLTNLYWMSYRSDEVAVPDSIEIALFNERVGRLVKKTIPIVDLGRKLLIENLLYMTNKHEIADTVKELDVLAEFLKRKPNLEILIEGHTDNIGSNAINNKLSLKRAKSVKQYFIKKGLKGDRIKTVGYGENRPIASNKTEFGRRLNRRTEIVIMSTDTK